MSDTSPSGWYPDPQRSADDPPRERRWDGEAWTDEVRAAIPAVFAAPAAPRKKPQPVKWLRARPFVAGILLGAFGMLVVGGGIVGGVALASDDDDPSPAVQRWNGPGNDDNGKGDDDGNGGRQEMPGPGNGGGNGNGNGGGMTEDGYATDLASGIKIPVPDGWQAQSGAGASAATGEYKCPADTSKTCMLGGVNSAPAAALKNTESTAKAAALKDIAANAEDSYGESAYGKTTSHEQLKSEAVTVAGQEGWLVRWKVVTEKGDDGYVQSVAFKSPADDKTMVIVRFGFDVNDKAPKLSQMDEITKGIKEAQLMTSGLGSGSGKSA
ncbi:DUF2510 domain-containing protein [Streptomyces sp. NPDC051940]|uniref:DUF2510 domain-containing protein n=1 Tax=Streptomyces sp. NPDC051940 TaxID=3155675 RepID=UPI00341A2162